MPIVTNPVIARRYTAYFPVRSFVDCTIMDFRVLVTDQSLDLRHVFLDVLLHIAQAPGRRISRRIWCYRKSPQFQPLVLRQRPRDRMRPHRTSVVKPVIFKSKRKRRHIAHLRQPAMPQLIQLFRRRLRDDHGVELTGRLRRHPSCFGAEKEWADRPRQLPFSICYQVSSRGVLASNCCFAMVAW